VVTGGQGGSGRGPGGKAPELRNPFGGAGDNPTGQGGDEAFNNRRDFDGRMKNEQQTIAKAGGGAAADEALGRAGQPGGADGAGGAGGSNAGGSSAGGAGGGGGGSSSVGGPGGGSGGSGSADVAPGPEEPTKTVQGCNDQDKVARQLCEAATQEKDPFLRGSLWNEYNEYKKILARQ
jgi:hypothetical protein